MATEKSSKSDELMMRNENNDRRTENANDENLVLFRLSLRSLSNITLILPLSGLFFCFVTGYIFQAEEIHETHCRVSIVCKRKFFPYFS